MTKSKLMMGNEEKLHQEEKERLRKMRIIQVREIMKQNSAILRDAFRQEKEKKLRQIVDKQISNVKQQHLETIHQAEVYLQTQVDRIGSGHVSAFNYDDLCEMKALQTVENQQKAIERGQTALVAHKLEKQAAEERENAHIVARQRALDLEKVRSLYVASLPKPHNELDELLAEEKEIHGQKMAKSNQRHVTLHNADVFVNTRYHMPETLVDKSDQNQEDSNGRQEALIEEEKSKQVFDDHKRIENEWREKARVRGKHALKKELLSINYNQILDDLSSLQRADRERRQKELSTIPKEIFAPSWIRDQEKKDFQMELERQFEKIYTDSNTRLEEMPEPLDMNKLSQTCTEPDVDLELTIIDENSCPQFKNELIHQPIEHSVEAPEENSKQNENNNQTILAKISDKIKKQRDEMTQKIAAGVNSSNMHGDQDDQDSEASVIEIKPAPVLSDLLDLTESSIQGEDEIKDEEHISDNIAIDFNQRSIKSLRNIMMSSHNVSSVLEVVDGGRVLLGSGASTARPLAFWTKKVEDMDRNSTKILDLSHASRDPILAGPRELFNKKENLEAIELKHQEIEKQQRELERRLKELEEYEAQIEAQKVNTPSHQIIDQQNDSEMNASSGSSLTESHSIENNRKAEGLSMEELKRIEYQQRLLLNHNSNIQIMAEKNPSLTSITNTNNSATHSDLLLMNQIEERKRAIMKAFDLSSSNCQSAASSSSSISNNHVNVASNNNKKVTVSSTGDSGFASSSSNQHFNTGLNFRQQQVESSEKQHLVSSSSSISSAFSECNSNRLPPMMDLYESSEGRDPSVEKLIQIAAAHTGLELIGEEDDTFHDEETVCSEEDQDDEDGRLLIMSLLNSSSTNRSNIFELKKQFFQEQLNAVRKQKENLIQSSVTLPPPVKTNRFVSDCNPHELSTIKEVDTPISERNFKIINNPAGAVSASKSGPPKPITKTKSAFTIISSSEANMSQSSTLENVSDLEDVERHDETIESESKHDLDLNSTPIKSKLINLSLFNSSLSNLSSNKDVENKNVSKTGGDSSNTSSNASLNHSKPSAFKTESFSSSKKWFDILCSDESNTSLNQEDYKLDIDDSQSQDESDSIRIIDTSASLTSFLTSNKDLIDNQSEIDSVSSSILINASFEQPSKNGGLFERLLSNFGENKPGSNVIMDEPELSFISMASNRSENKKSSNREQSESGDYDQDSPDSDCSVRSIIAMHKKRLEEKLANLSLLSDKSKLN